MQEKNQLAFPGLSDPGNSVACALEVLTQPSAQVLEVRREHCLDLASTNADGTIELPMPTVAVLDESLGLWWLDVHPDYTSRAEPHAILVALDKTTAR
jgi:peroxiredoxin